jgi:hypothetical protein
VKIMKKLLFGVALAMIVASCIPSSVIRGSGREARGEFDIRLNYTSLEVSSGITVELVRSDTATGFITADEEVLEHVAIVEEDGVVKVSYEPFITVQSKIKTVVTMPLSENLARLDVSSAGRVVSDEKLRGPLVEIEGQSAASIEMGVDAGEVRIDLSSAAKLQGGIVAETLAVEQASASKCEVSGSVGVCVVEVSSAAIFRGAELECLRATVEAASGANAEISATEELDARAASGGSVRYRGTPAIIKRDTSSGGSVREIN